MRSLTSLRLIDLILHKVPAARRHDEEPPPVRLSNVLIELTDPQRLYFQQRLRNALGKDAREVAETVEVEYDVPEWVRAFLRRDDTDLVALSRRLATKLREVQSGASNDGLLLVAACEWDNEHTILIAKVELERGIRAEPEESDGRITFTVSLLEDLVFGETSRVFKIGLFSSADIDDDGRLTGWAVDRQRAGPDLAGFFLHEYLGCDYAQRSDVITKTYFDDTQRWINTLTDDEKRARYEVALLSDLQSSRSEVKPQAFARDHFDEDDRADFAASLSPSINRRTFAKDTTLVPITRVKVTTARGVTVIAEPALVGDADDDVVQVEQSRVTIRDEVTDVSGHGRQRRQRPPIDDLDEPSE